jgi:hypothetical protein
MIDVSLLYLVMIYITVLILLYIIFKGKALGLWFV